MDQTELISVIVPVYKVEKYLDRCVQSIVDQTYRNLEIILVDDGSPDNCPAMCDIWAAKDDRIRVIHQKNAGSGAARNAALDIAGGELIAFVDSDDYLAPDMYEHLYGMLQQGAQIAECDYVDVYDDGVIFKGIDDLPLVLNGQEAMAAHIQDKMFRQIIWNKLYRREVIGDIRFPIGKRIDDEFFTYQVIGNASKLIRSDRVCYAYRQQPESVMHMSFSMPRLQALDAKCRRLRFLEEHMPELVSQARVNLWYTCLYMGQMSLLHMSKEEQKAAFKEIAKSQALFPIIKDEKQKFSLNQRIWAILSDCSFKTACRIRNILKIGL